MSKYINADELIDEIIFNEEDVGIIGSKEVIDIIHNMPSADVVEVVRCKDCKYRGKGLPYCAYFSETDFCSKGERKETK